MNDPRDKTHYLTLAEGQGDIALVAGAIESVKREGMATLKVSIRGHMSLYVDNSPGLYAELLRSMAVCAEYQDAQAELASQAIQ